MYSLIETSEFKVWGISDTHFFHAGPRSGIPLWKSRGYNSPIDMTHGILKKINDVVRPSDILIHLGDFCLDTSLEQFNWLLDSIQCQTIYYVTGNHENPHFKQIYLKLLKEKYGDCHFAYPIKYKNMVYVGPYLEICVNNQLFICSHFPFMIWNKMETGSIHLTGHSHGSCRNTNSKNTYGKILDIGVDEFNGPISFSDIIKLINSKLYASVKLDHHG